MGDGFKVQDRTYDDEMQLDFIHVLRKPNRGPLTAVCGIEYSWVGGNEKVKVN